MTMICKYCGCRLPDDAVFCEQCGSRIAPPAGEGNVKNNSVRKSRAPIWIACISAAVLLIAGGAFVAVWYFSGPAANSAQQKEISENADPDSFVSSKEKNNRDEIDADGDSDTGNNDSDSAGTDLIPDTDGSFSGQGNDSTSPFIISPEANASYAAALDPSTYEFYSSSTDEFNFWYPTDFYNEVTYNTRPGSISYGTNIEEITFSAKDGSQLIFQAVQRTDDLDIKTMSNRVYTTEFGRLSSPEVILNTVKDDYGKIVITGWDKNHTDNTVYCLTKVKPDVILQMTVFFPDYTDETDRLRKSYMTECYYRMCGFSNADSWRTYEDFVRENG